jgi:hypothetical protein
LLEEIAELHASHGRSKLVSFGPRARRGKRMPTQVDPGTHLVVQLPLHCAAHSRAGIVARTRVMEIFAATAKEFFLRSQWLTASKRARNEHGTETLSWMQDVDGGWMADGCRMGVGNPAGVCQTGYCTVAKAIIAIVKEPARGHMALRPRL